MRRTATQIWSTFTTRTDLISSAQFLQLLENCAPVVTNCPKLAWHCTSVDWIQRCATKKIESAFAVACPCVPLPGQWLRAKVWRKSENKLWTWNRACGSRLLQEKEASGEAVVTFQAILWVTAWKELRRKSIPYLSPFLLQWQWLRLLWQLNNGKCQGVFPSSHPEETLCPWYIA